MGHVSTAGGGHIEYLMVDRFESGDGEYEMHRVMAAPTVWWYLPPCVFVLVTSGDSFPVEPDTYLYL